MDLKIVYEASYSFLVSEAEPYNISIEMIDQFISNPDVEECNNRESAYLLLLSILQDFNIYANIINYSKRKYRINRILNNGNIEYIAALNEDKLLADFRTEFAFEKETAWRRYCRSVISGATFMSQFHDDNEFKKTFDSFDKNEMTREAFALLLSSKIYNMGFASACNWLKELGYYRYAKPDTHTKDVCKALGLISNNDPIACFEAIAKTANEAGVEAYKVDKVWWLICSGDFYRYGIQLPNPQKRKATFLKMLQDMHNTQI